MSIISAEKAREITNNNKNNMHKLDLEHFILEAAKSGLNSIVWEGGLHRHDLFELAEAGYKVSTSAMLVEGVYLYKIEW